MKTFYISKREVWINTLEIQADSVEQALKIVDSYSDEEQINFEYSHELPKDHWTVEILNEDGTTDYVKDQYE